MQLGCLGGNCCTNESLGGSDAYLLQPIILPPHVVVSVHIGEEEHLGVVGDDVHGPNVPGVEQAASIIAPTRHVESMPAVTGADDDPLIRSGMQGVSRSKEVPCIASGATACLQLSD